MNERFLEIAKQAKLKFPSETALSPVEEKFAELIVKECADLFDKNETEVRIPEHRIHESIMIHFGLY